MKNESYYHTVLLSWLLAYGFDIKSEDATSDGRIDPVLERKDSVVIAEFKYSHDKEDGDGNMVSKAKSLEMLFDDATGQIHDKEYYKKYYNKNKIILLGVDIFNKEIGVKFDLLN